MARNLEEYFDTVRKYYKVPSERIDNMRSLITKANASGAASCIGFSGVLISSGNTPIPKTIIIVLWVFVAALAFRLCAEFFSHTRDIDIAMQRHNMNRNNEESESVYSSSTPLIILSDFVSLVVAILCMIVLFFFSFSLTK